MYVWIRTKPTSKSVKHINMSLLSPSEIRTPPLLLANEDSTMPESPPDDLHLTVAELPPTLPDDRPDMMPGSPEEKPIFASEDWRQAYRDLLEAIRKGDLDYLRRILCKPEAPRAVNLSEDPPLSVVIANLESGMAIKLIREMPPRHLTAKNYAGDTALHVAAAKGFVGVAEALVERSNRELLFAKNKQGETPIHKAALFGEQGVFRKLQELGGKEYTEARTEGGATVLHCAIMGSAFELALDIAKKYPKQMTTRNEKSVTPLQLIVSISDVFRSQLQLGPLDSLTYAWIPMEEPLMHKNSDESRKDDKCLQFLRRLRGKTPPNCATIFDLLELAYVPVKWALLVVKWAQVLVFKILRPLATRIRKVERQKKNHIQAMTLVAHLAKDPEYWDFAMKGREPEKKFRSVPTTSERTVQPPGNEGGVRDSSLLANAKQILEYCIEQSDYVRQIIKVFKEYARSHDIKDEGTPRWDDSPLILGAKMGLHEFVKVILQVCPESAVYSDVHGKNFLHVAIEHGREEIVEIVESMASEDDSKLPAQLFSDIHKDTGNTILHFAAEKTVEGEAFAMQMQYELQWFEKVKKLVPGDLMHSRNNDEKTAHELFTENHEGMVKSAKDQLMEMGKTLPGLLAAVVFASSFSIPGQGVNDSKLLHKTAFKVFSNSYVFGLSCAATALLLFLSFLTSPYRQKDFRSSIPMKFFFATVSFFLALVSLLVAFACNIYLTIYGSRKAETKAIVPFACELTIFPAVCVFVLLYRGANFGIGNFFRRVWR